MKKIYLLAINFLMVLGCSSGQDSLNPDKPNAESKKKSTKKVVEETPSSLAVKHINKYINVIPKSTRRKIDYPHKWYYRTEIKNNTKLPIQIIKFDLQYKSSNSWKSKNVYNDPRTSKEFSEWYSSGATLKNGWIQPGEKAVNENNWHGSSHHISPKMKWAFWGKDENGKEYYCEKQVDVVQQIPFFHNYLGEPNQEKRDPEEVYLLDKGPMSKWKKGMWWITETHSVNNVSRTMGRTGVWMNWISFHKWVVKGNEAIQNEKCWVIDVFPHNLPKKVKNDHGDEFLFRLYLSKANGTLREFDYKLRSGNYSVTGRLKEKSYLMEKKDVPLILGVISPFIMDFPILPNSWHDVRTYGKEKKFKGRHDVEVTQNDELVFLESRKKNKPVIYITLKKENYANYQTWEYGCPWWKESRRFKDIRRYKWFAKTIDWKGKKKAAKK